MIVLAILFSSFAHASTCDLAKNETLNCDLSWSEGSSSYTYQLYTSENGCEFPEGRKRTCAHLRVCKDGNEIAEGASVLMDPKISDSYCETKKPVDLFASSDVQAHGFVTCKNKKPVSIKLQNLKDEKICSLPLWKELK